MRSVIDKTIALDRVGGDEQLLGEAAGILLEDLPGWRAELSQALENSDAPIVRRVAHTIKGAVDVFGAQAAHDAALRLEEIAAGGDLNGASEAAADLERELERLLPELEELGRKTS